jgi:hypothetical protein
MPQKTVHRFKHVVPLTQDDIRELAETGRLTIHTRGVTYSIIVDADKQDFVDKAVIADREAKRVIITLGADLAERLVSGRRTSLVYGTGEYVQSVEPLQLAEEIHDVSFFLDRSGTNVETFTVFE